MRKSIKITLYVLLATVLTFLITVSVVPLVFDPNDYKQEITEAVRKHTGRHLEIEDDLKLQILPKLAVLTGRISMNNPEGFGRETFAEFDSGFFRIDLIPLFSKRIGIKKIVLNGLKVHLIRTKDGRANWKRFRGSAPKPGKYRIPIRYENERPARIVTMESPLALLMSTKIDILGAEVDYDDRKTGIKFALKDLEFIIDRFVFDRDIYFRIQGNLSSEKPLFRKTAAISGRIFVNESLDKFKVEEFRWNSKIDSDFVPEEFRQIDLTTTAEMNFAADTFSATNLKLVAGQTSLGANLSASRILANPTLEGQISVEQANPGKLLKLAKFDYTPKDTSVFQTLNGNFAIALDESKLMINNIALVLDGNPIKGITSITGFESPKIKFNFSARHLDADRYLPESGAPPLPVNLESVAPDAVVNRDRPTKVVHNTSQGVENTTVQGILNLGSLRYKRMLAEGVQMAFNISNGVIRANQRFKKFYGGRLKGSMEFNYRDPVPALSLNQHLADVQIGSLLEELNGKKAIEGTLNTTLRLVGHGTQIQDLKSSLNGDISAMLINGRFHGVDLVGVIRNAKNLIKVSESSGSTADITEFSKLTYKATVNGGVLNGTLLKGESTNFDFQGDGKIDLKNDAIDYRIDAVVNNNPDGIAGIKIKELQGAHIPIQIGGTLSSPTFRPALKGVLQDPKIKSAADKLKQKLDKKLGDGAGRLLDSLL